MGDGFLCKNLAAFKPQEELSVQLRNGMRNLLCLMGVLLLSTTLSSQDLYFPPITGDTWENIDPTSMGWCSERVDDLIHFVGEKNTKSLLILKDGKIVIEQYYDDHDQGAPWYWASAGKSLVGMLVGLAQEDGFIDINEPTRTYLGSGWTSTTTNQEAQITIKSQLSMASGLDDGVEAVGSTQNCFEPACFQYLAPPYGRWAYHNSAYRILQNVLETTTGQNKFNYTRSRLGDRIGMKGFWLNYVYYSSARDMARFGLLALNRGIWATDTLLHDTTYFNAMINPSQSENPSYGYLWWLNGQSAFQLPGIQLKINRMIIPEAPSDLFAALGKNDQKIYVVPSEGLVVIRQGESAGGIALATSSFDSELWERLGNMSCTVSSTSVDREIPFSISPNPVGHQIHIQTEATIQGVRIYNMQGQLVYAADSGAESVIPVSGLLAGTYFVQVRTSAGVSIRKVVKV